MSICRADAPPTVAIWAVSFYYIPAEVDLKSDRGDATMIRAVCISVFAIALCSFAASALVAPALAAHCVSIEARCAIEAGGHCDVQKSHWCVGSKCGGDHAAFEACLERHGIQREPASARAAATPATASDFGKCTSAQGRCAVEAGGICNRRTGWWCVGGMYASRW